MEQREPAILSSYSATELPSFETCFSGKHACCFTGHRPAGLPDARSSGLVLLRKHLMETICAAADYGVTEFLAGGARGFDTIAADAVLYLRDVMGYPIALKLLLPSPRQTERWPAEDRDRYETILDLADDKAFLSDTNDAAAMHKRDRALVDNADCCICYLKKMKGGTLYTVNYAIDRGIPVYNLALLVRS